MKQHILIVIGFMIIHMSAFAQIKFEKGYFIDDKGTRTNCFIKNIDWGNSKNIQIEYKKTEEGEIKTADVKRVTELGITNFSRYIKRSVKIDTSAYELDYLDNIRAPKYKEQTLFLEVLIEGKADLYVTGGGKNVKFFYSIDDSDPKQLVYKRYLSGDSKIRYNNNYRQELLNYMICSSMTESKQKSSVQALTYARTSLRKYFSSYHECEGEKFIDYEGQQRSGRDVVQINLRPGICFSSYSTDNEVGNNKDVSFGWNVDGRLGIELESILPFNKNKWSIVLEPTYQQFVDTGRAMTGAVQVTYRAIDVSLGGRYYAYLNDASALFLTVAIVRDFTFGSGIDYETGTDLTVSGSYNATVGLGYKYKRTYSIELEYGRVRNFLTDYAAWNSFYRPISLTLGYRIFHK